MSEVRTKSSFNPHEFNNYIYNNFPSISSNEKMLLIVCVLLTISSNVQLKEPIELRCLEVERSYGMEDYFKFIMNQPYNQAIKECFKYFKDIRHDNLTSILLKCFIEISHWSFKLAQGKSIKQTLTRNEGAVLTPQDIVDLMINELDIKSFDVVCDPCCGTGSFLINSLSKTQQLIGNELDLTRSIVAKHGLLISGITNPIVTQVDCLSIDYVPSFDWLLMNPPYDHQREQSFCLKFIDLARKGGAVIIPISNFRNEEFKSRLCQICNPIKLIILNNKVFVPIANIQTAILIFDKQQSSANDGLHLEVYNFMNDGFEVKINKGRVFKSVETPKLMKTVHDSSEAWDTMSETINTNETVEKLMSSLKQELINRQIDKFLTEVSTVKPTFGTTINYTLSLPEVNKSNIQWFNFNDIFEFINTTRINDDNNDYPLFGAT